MRDYLRFFQILFFNGVFATGAVVLTAVTAFAGNDLEKNKEIINEKKSESNGANNSAKYSAKYSAKDKAKIAIKDAKTAPQGLTQDQALTWQQCLQEAAAANADIKSAETRVASSRLAKEKAAKSMFLPQVAANLGVQRSGQSSDLAGVQASSTDTTFSASVTGSENLFSGFADQRRLEQSQLELQAEEGQLAILKVRLGFEISNAFSRVIHSQAQIRMAEDVLNRRQKNMDLVQLRFEGGRENKGAVLLSQAYLQQAHYEKLQAQKAMMEHKWNLVTLIGKSEDSGFDVKGDFPPPPVPKTLPDLTQLLAQQPQYQLALVQEAAAVKQIKLAEAGYYPSLDLSASVSRRDPNFFPEQQRQWSIGLNLNVPIVSGGRDYYGRKEAMIKVTEKGWQRQQIARNLRYQLQQAFQDYELAMSRLTMLETFLEAAQLRADIARKKYSNGLIGFDDWDRIENELIDREQQVLQGRLDKILAAVSWQQATGKAVIP